MLRCGYEYNVVEHIIDLFWSNIGVITTRRAMTKNTLQNVVFPIRSDVYCIIDCANYVKGFFFNLLCMVDSVATHVISYRNNWEATLIRMKIALHSLDHIY